MRFYTILKLNRYICARLFRYGVRFIPFACAAMKNTLPHPVPF